MSRPQRVRVPWRVVTSSLYADSAVTVYVKVGALAQRPEGCTASVRYLSGLLGIARSTVERALTQLMRPAPDDEVVELTSYRRTHPGGTGTTAVRRVRQQSRTELGAWVPSRAAEALSPRQLRAYLALSYAVATKHHITLAEIGEVLRHRTGKKAGEALNTRSVRKVLNSLEDLGWITIDRRAGLHGRHIYSVHEEPVQLCLEADGADSEEGSGGDLGEGSLATEEDLRTDSPDDEAAGEIRRRREQVVARGPVENPAVETTGATGKQAYAGPGLTLAPRIWRVLEPVHHLLGDMTTYVIRRAAREIGSQLDRGVAPAQLHARLQHRVACTEEIRNPGGWLLGAGLTHRGCGRATCESGTDWTTGDRCRECLADAARQTETPPRTKPVPRPPKPAARRSWHECDDCGRPSPQPIPSGRCRDCRPNHDTAGRLT
ncbi:hypothetical protein HHL19_16180 [Streptomyces sp. R302]|uniref:hypothetical protein n=1 Tax=unclassified Streptomyces TaxID=2593676 RepID=UPI00145CA336|nr:MULTISPECIES: hypothetical protein [unclassified Streptomyces]NML55311.1 hypothetical protein [Streptomyces sp. R301]NML80183.1 hypothetical protein [Streptomyces sp. R302]